MQSPANAARTGTSRFERCDGGDITDLIAEYPLAWVTAPDGNAEHASVLPLLVTGQHEETPTVLLGHMALHNPLVATFANDPRASILFLGPQAYVGPAAAGDRAWVPTWNFVQIRIEATIQLLPLGGDDALRRLVDRMEAAEVEPWSVEETGARYQSMERAIIAFEARIERVLAKFKLGQDERPEVLHHILENHLDANLVRWMRRMNGWRL